jgi:hypothetical protein
MTFNKRMFKRLPLWSCLVGVAWMTIAIRLVAIRAILVTDYIGWRTATFLPNVEREVTRKDDWVLNGWLLLTSGLEFALLGLLLRFVVNRFFHPK